MTVYEIEAEISRLPPHIISEINDYIDFLLFKYEERKVTEKRFKFNWEGGLSELKKEFTSVELQHKVSEWR